MRTDHGSMTVYTAGRFGHIVRGAHTVPLWPNRPHHHGPLASVVLPKPSPTRIDAAGADSDEHVIVRPPFEVPRVRAGASSCPRSGQGHPAPSRGAWIYSQNTPLTSAPLGYFLEM